jgi:putative ABC transport system permease protein
MATGEGIGSELGRGWSHGLGADMRYALRQLRSAPGFALTAVLTLALTVGLAATVFSVFDAVLVRPLPFGHVSELMDVRTIAPEGYSQPASWPEYKFWRDNGARVLDIAGFQETTANLQAGAQPIPVHALGVSANFFRVMDVHPVLGRVIGAGQGEHGNTSVAVLSYAMWQKRFGGQASVIGSKVDLNGAPLTVIGVTPAGFRFPLAQPEQIYVPVLAVPEFAAMLNLAGDHWLSNIARLQPGITREQAESAMQPVLLAYAHQQNEADLLKRRMHLVPIAKSLLGQTSGLVESLALAVLAVLVLGCVNIAGLMLARGLRRERELALRAALGASRLRLARQLMVELCLLALGGTIGGFAFAAGLLAATRSLLIAALDRGADVHLNLMVFAASMAAALLTLLLAGLLPLRQILSVAPAAALRSGSQSAGSSRGRNRLRSSFLAAQVALAMLLLMTSALLLAALHGARTTVLGFRPDHLLLEEVALTPGRVDAGSPYTLFYQPLLAKLKALPGVTDAALTSRMPLSGSGNNNSEVSVEGEPPAAAGQDTLADVNFVSPGYFPTMGLRLLHGRVLEDGLDGHGTQDVVVNQAFVRRFLKPGEDPVGRKINAWGGMPIVGVVSDMRQGLFEPIMPEFDMLPSGLPADPQMSAVLRDTNVVMRTGLPPAQLREPLRLAMASVDPTAPYRPAMTMDDVMAEVLTLQRLENWLFGSFGALSLLLALVGLYGLVSQEVEQSRRAIGIRMALGAARGRVLRDTLQRVAVVSGCGVAIGAALSYASQQVLRAIMPKMAPHALLLGIGLACAMELLAVWAAFAPARRAASVDPVEVLRAE